MSDTFKRQKGADKDLPAEVRLVGTFGGGFVLTDAEHFDSSFVLSPAEYAVNYGGNPNQPPTEAEVTQARANAQNDEAIQGYRRGDQPAPANVAAHRAHAAAEGRPTETPEEVFASDASA